MLRFPVAVAFLFLPLFSIAKPAAVPGEYLVKVRSNSIKALGSFSRQAKAVVAEDGIYKISLPNAKAEREFLNSTKQKSSEFEYVEPNYIYSISRMTVNDPKLKSQWALSNLTSGINIDKAWDISRGSDRIIVAVIDTGIDYTHPDLVNNMWRNEAEANGVIGLDDDDNGYVDDVYGYNFVKKNGNPKDDHNHGTHCAGIIGAGTNNGLGIASPNWNVSLMGLKFLDAKGSGTSENAILAIDYAIKMKANILSNSWGGDGYSKALEAAILRAQAAGILFVAAAGNEANNNDKKPFYPAGYKVGNVISVAATNSFGSLAGFSNFGVNTVHIAAPGENILSTVAGTGYAYMSGTSMAAPLVSGVAAQVWAYASGATYAEVRAKVLNGARPVATLKNKVRTGATLDAYRALLAK
ncbi:MAG: S8 family peptidase [Bdellovibrionota bacterium]